MKHLGIQFCSTCKTEPARRGQRTCVPCHRANQRTTRVRLRDEIIELRTKAKLLDAITAKMEVKTQ